jgi:hypothetical protein
VNTAPRSRTQLLYEHRSQPLLPPQAFLQRMINHGGVSLAMTAVALAIGMVGYRVTEGLSWLDSFLNAAMILGGMGEVAPLLTTGGKLFAGLYALFSGLVILAAASVLVVPVVHRLLHRLHLEDDARND